MNTAEYLAERKERADMAAFDRILNRKGGEPPPPGDELPESPTNETKLVCDF